MQEIKTLKEQVEYCLINFPETRNSDITLMLKIWEIFYGKTDIHIRKSELYDLPREDAVKRIRAKFQNDYKLYLPTDEKVAKQRAWNVSEWRSFLGYKIQGELF